MTKKSILITYRNTWHKIVHEMWILQQEYKLISIWRRLRNCGGVDGTELCKISLFLNPCPIKTEMITSPFYTWLNTFHQRKYSAFVIFVCLPHTFCYLFITQYWKVIESLYFSGKLTLMLVNGGVILKSKGQRSRSLKTKM